MDTEEKEIIDREEAATSGPRWGQDDRVRPRSETAQFKYGYRLVYEIDITLLKHSLCGYLVSLMI